MCGESQKHYVQSESMRNGLLSHIHPNFIGCWDGTQIYNLFIRATETTWMNPNLKMNSSAL